MSQTPSDGIIETGDPNYRLNVTDSGIPECLPTVTLQVYTAGDGWRRLVSTLLMPSDTCPAYALRRHLMRLDDLLRSAERVPA